jgi:hypothetical protein
MKKIRFYNIVYDFDDEIVEVTPPDAFEESVPADFDVNECGADLISNITGWLVEDFEWEELRD